MLLRQRKAQRPKVREFKLARCVRKVLHAVDADSEQRPVIASRAADALFLGVYICTQQSCAPAEKPGTAQSSGRTEESMSARRQISGGCCQSEGQQYVIFYFYFHGLLGGSGEALLKQKDGAI